MSPSNHHRARCHRGLIACLFTGSILSWCGILYGQEAQPTQQPAQPARPKPRERQRTTTPKKTADEPRPADATQNEQPKDAEGQTQAPAQPPQNAAQPVVPPPGVAPESQPAPKPAVPEPAPQTQPTEAPKKPDEAQTDAAKRVEEARKAAADRAAARRARASGADGTITPGAAPGAQPPTLPSSEPTAEIPSEGGPVTPINIAPAESNIPPEERTYGFSIKDGSYEQLIEGFARQTGLGVIGEAPKEGKVSFVTTESLNFDQALARVRMLLFNYKPHEPYWILRNESNLQVIRVNDFYRILPRNRMFSSIEEFRAANLSNDELALVIYTPRSGSVSELRQVRDWLPDYVRVTPLEDQNRVTIFALVSDIEKYMELISFFLKVGRTDPRILERIEIHHILPTDALNKLRSFMDLDGAGGAVKGGGAAASGRRPPREPSPIENMPEPPVSVIPDDAQGLLIVRAMQDKIDEIKLLLPYIDVDTSGSAPAPVIIKVQHADATELIGTIQQILSSSAAPGGAPAAPKPKKGKRSGSAGATSATVPAGEGVSPDSVTMIRHPSDNAIIVLADDAGVAKVRELVTLFDVATRLEDPVRLSLAHADANEVLNTITAVLGATGPKGQNTLDRFQVVVDPAGDMLWFMGNEKDLQKVRDLISMLDAPDAPVALHTYRCVYQEPTFIANMLREFESTNPAAPAPAPAQKKPKTKRVKASAPPSKFTPDDARKTLYVICSDDEWARYELLIKDLDRAVESPTPFVKLPVQHLSPDAAIERLTNMMGAAGVEETAKFVPSDGAIILIGVNPSELEQAKAFMVEIDKPTAMEKRTFEIRHANPSDIKAVIESLISDAPAAAAPPRKRGKAEKAGTAITSSTTAEMTIVELGRRLVVHTSPARMEQVAELIAEFDVPEEKTELKVYSDFPPGTNIDAISDTISSVFSGPATGPRTRRSEGGGADGPRFIPQPASGRLVVIAEPALLPEIERLLAVLRHDVASQPPVVTFINVQHADPAELVDTIQPLLDIKIRGLVDAGELDNSVEDAPASKTNKRRSLPTQTAGGDRYHLSPDSRNKRIVIAAPQVVVDQAKALVAQFDIPGDRAVFKTVELANADPAEMVRAVKEMMGRSSAPRKSPATKLPKGAGAGNTPEINLLNEGELSVVEAPGGGAIILHGPPSEVKRAEEWITTLDAMSTRGRTIKVYDLKTADTGKVFDLVVNVVGASSGAAAAKALRPRGKKGEVAEEEEEFTTRRSHSGQDLYIDADLVSHTMLVAATPSKITQIDDIVKSFEKPEIKKMIKVEPPVPKLVYDLEFANGTDAAWDLEAVLDSMWEPPGELPKVESIGDTLIVRYPHEDRFDEIRDFIRRFADKPDKEDIKIQRKSFPAPPGLSASQAAAWIKMNHPEFEVELKDIGPEKEETFDIEQLRPNGASKRVSPCVLPGALQNLITKLGAQALAQIPPDEQPEPVNEDEPEDEDVVEDEPVEEPLPVPSDDMIRRAAMPLLQQRAREKETVKEVKKPTESKDEPKADRARKPGSGERLEIDYDDTAGVFLIKGRAIDIKEVEGSMKDLEDEIKDFQIKPDIRIYRVRYIDVFSAQDILEEMFNVTKQQQAFLSQQQQQMQRAQQVQQQRQGQMGQQGRGQQQGDQQGGPGQPGGPGAPGAPGGRPGAQQPQVQPQMAVAQLPQAGVRIYPNPRDRTLILRAETSQYPQILELLATIDQPKPIDSEMRTYPLKNLNAGEVEEILREMIGIGKDGSRPRAARGQAQAGAPGVNAPSTGPGESLPKTVLQKTISGLSELNVDPDDIKLFSSDISNTVMAVAPVAALDFLGDIINRLESEDIPQRITKYYELQHADADDAASFLASHFDEARAGKSSRKSAGEGAPAAAGGKGMNAPSFIPYPRLNLLTVHATQVQLEEIDTLVQRIDVKGEQDQWENVSLAHADAKLVADTLSQMFGEKSGGAAAKSGAPRGGAVPKFIGEAGGGLVFFSAPGSRHKEILDAIKRLEDQYKETRTPRIIDLKNGTPSAIAEAIEKAFDAKQGGGKAAGGATRFTITGHDPTKRLFVIADDETFKEVASLVKLLDDKPGTIGVEFRIYPMKHASAKAIHAQLTKLLKDYLGRLGPAASSAIDAFSVEPDEISNSLIVLGGPTVFGFIEENLRKVDTPAMAVSRPASMIIPVTNANAQELAGNIQKIYAQKEQPLGVTPPQVEANQTTNVLIIRGTQAQIDEIKRDMIDPLEAQTLAAQQLQRKTYKLKFADPGNIQDVINRLFQTDSRSARDKVTAVPEFTSNSVIVSASPENLKKVEDLLAQIDRAEVSQQDVHVVEIKHADASSVAQTLTEIFVRSGAKQVGNQPPPITIASVAGSRALLIKSKPEDFARIQATLKELDTEDVGTAGEVRVVTLLYADAAEVNTAMQEYLRKPGSGGRGGDLSGGVRLSAMSQSNSIMVSGANEELDRLESILKGLDIAGEKGSVPQIIPLKYITAGLILPSLQQVFTDARGGQRRNQPPPVIVADEGSNAIIVRASPSDLTAIQDMVTKLDTEDKKDKSRFVIIRVKSGINVEELAEQVEVSLNESAKAQAGGARGVQVPSLTATPDRRTSTITLAGSPTLFADAEAMIKRIEELGPSGDAATRIVKVENMKVEQIQKMIDQLTQQQGGQGQRGGARPRPSRSRP